MTTLQEAAQYRSLYEVTGDIKDLNTMLVPRTALAQQREQQPVCHGCGIPAGDVHMSTCKSGKWPSRVSNGDTAAPAPQAQEPAKCNHCGGTGELEQFTSAGAPTTKMVCLFCKGDKSFPVFKDKNPELAWIEQCKRDEEPAPQPAQWESLNLAREVLKLNALWNKSTVQAPEISDQLGICRVLAERVNTDD